MAKKKRIRWEDHPSIMLMNGQPRLKVFEEYSVEEDLPKFKKLVEEDAKKKLEDQASLTPNLVMSPETADMESISRAMSDKRPSDLSAAKDAKWSRTRYVRLRAGSISGQKEKGGVIQALRNGIRKLHDWACERTSDAPVSVEETFRLAKEDELTLTTEELLRSRAIAVSLANRFKQTCQYGMAKKIEDHLETLSSELALAARGMCTYLTEEQAIEFMTKAERGVQVEFLRYYPEIIPEDVAKKMLECNLAMLFDNYVVMYYSKDAKPVRLLEDEIDEEERHRRRDPILFGTLRGSRKLYYVADWIYKDDDLTISTVEKAIGTLPTLKDERISDSQFKLEEALHAFNKAAEDAVEQAKETGTFVPIDAEAMANAGF